MELRDRRLVIVPRFVFGRRHVANGFEQAPVVEPVDPVQGREFDGFKMPPRSLKEP